MNAARTRAMLRAATVAGALLLGACSSMPRADANGLLQFEGTVQSVVNDCFFDGVCTVTVDGIVVTTMSGERLGNPVWGQSDGQPQPGQRVGVRCRATGARSCTLRGDTGYFLRHLH